MEFASLEDAFPSSGSEKRRTFRVNDPPLPPTDADRPAVKRMTDVAAMNKEQIPDSLLDESTKFANKPSVMNSLPTAETLTKFKQTKAPSYFGVEPFANPSEDTLSPFLKNTSNPNAFMLENDFTKSFSEDGYMRAAGVDLPVPELRNRWKLMSSDRIESSKVASKPSHFPGMDVGDLQNLRTKIDELMARIDDLENRAAGANPQLEVLTFVMTGLFLMFIVDLAVRKSSGVRMVSVR